MAVNGIGELSKTKHTLKVDDSEPRIEMILSENTEQSDYMVKALEFQIMLLKEQYSDYLNLTYSEV
jgi:uncharacterized protein YsxB (DUF464 family)